MFSKLAKTIFKKDNTTLLGKMQKDIDFSKVVDR